MLSKILRAQIERLLHVVLVAVAVRSASGALKELSRSFFCMYTSYEGEA